MSKRNRDHLIVLVLTALLGLQACRDDGRRGANVPRSRSAQATAAATAGQQPVAWQAVANASYAGIFDQPVRLIDGRWEGEPYAPGAGSRPSLHLIEGFWAQGDLDGDTSNEAIVFLAESSGGSSTRVYIAVVGQRDGQPVNLGTALIGDRVQLRILRLIDGRVEVDVVQRGPDEAACCPTQKAKRIWKLESQGLSEVSAEVTGPLSLADLAGVEWSLTHFAWNEPAPTGLEITLTVEDGRIGGSSGCNRYFADIEESQPGNIGVSEIGSTRMACPEDVMESESRYLAAIVGVNKYSFLAGKLALSYRSDEAFHTLLFAANAQNTDASSSGQQD
jgi:heat shock protein HslJ